MSVWDEAEELRPKQQTSPPDDEHGWFGAKSKTGAALRSGVEGFTYGMSGELAGLEAARDPYAALRGIPGNPHTKEGLIERYRTGREQADVARQKGAAEHPVIAGAAELGGALLSPVPGSALIKGASLGARALHGLKTGATVGGMVGFGKSTADVTKGEIGRAAGDITGGMASGGAIGAVANPLLGAAGEWAASRLASRAEDNALLALNNPGISDRMAQMGLATDAEKRQFARAAIQSGLVRPLDSAASIATRADEYLSRWGDEIGDVIKIADTSGKKPDWHQASMSVMSSMDPRSEVERLASGPTEKLAEALWTQGEKAKAGGPSSFDLMRRAKSAAQGSVNWQAEAPLSKELYREGTSALRGEFVGQMQGAVSQSDYRRLLEANRRFGVASDVAALAGNKASREAAKSSMSITAMGFGAAASQAVGGGPIGAAVGAAAAPVVGWARRRVPATMSSLYESAAQTSIPAASGIATASELGAAGIGRTPKPSGNKQQDDEDAINAWIGSGR